MENELSTRPYRDILYPRLLEGGSGRWTAERDHFEVVEVPRYTFCGEGEHAALKVEKVGLTTREVALDVASQLGLKPSAVGYAGMKDKLCRSVQGFTVTGVGTDVAARAFEEAGCKVVEATRHKNKLRLGHLAGNQFRVFIEGGDHSEAVRRLEHLAETGAPNYYGPQRFGSKGVNHLRGLEVVKGKRRANRWQRDLYVSALQSIVFNDVVGRRIENGLLDCALEGDVLQKIDSGGSFVCEDAATDEGRIKRFELSPTGPMFGRKMLSPGGETLAAEAASLKRFGLTADHFAKLNGARRPLRVKVREPSVGQGDGGIWVGFMLEPGAYATAVVRELTEEEPLRV